ncbi:AAA+ ATPase domain-containing protein [Flavobacterium branchiophilum]
MSNVYICCKIWKIMKICSIHIKGYKQFQDTYIDFTNPETGEPVNKVCFIGKNGTGKTTILRIINEFVDCDYFNIDKFFWKNCLNISFLIKIKINDQFLLVFKNFIFLYNSEIEKCFAEIDGTEDSFKEFISQNKINVANDDIMCKVHDFWKKKDFLHIYAPSESHQNHLINIEDVPQSSVNEALQLFHNFPNYHEVSDQNIQYFWTLLIYLIKKREEEQQLFENKPENLSKTKRELLAEFEKINPKILDKIAILWNKILDKAGLEFDVENANNPIQLTDNLKAYIRLKGTKENIPYSELSTGIRNFIFRVGHIFSLYFNKEVKTGFLLIDEPENSLFPDFLFELIETYQEIVNDKNGENNTQIFMTTHNPIIAAQFEPYERIILDWNENGTVKASKGITPAGDDPNDILERDFKLPNLMGKKGMEFWEKYLALKQALRKSTNEDEKMELSDKITAIGTSYNF